MRDACRRSSSKSRKDRPLRCARFRPAAATEQDEARFQEWLRSMEAKYRLVAREKYPLTFFVHEHELQYIDQVEMYEFVPVEARTASQAAGTVPGRSAGSDNGKNLLR